MSKIKELISTVWTKTDSDSRVYDIYVSDIEDVMKAYAEYYAQKCINAIASNYVTVNCPTWEIVDRKTILEFELPDHELKDFPEMPTGEIFKSDEETVKIITELADFYGIEYELKNSKKDD